MSTSFYVLSRCLKKMKEKPRKLVFSIRKSLFFPLGWQWFYLSTLHKISNNLLSVFLCRMTWLPFTTLPPWEKEEHAAIWQRLWWICCWKEKSRQAVRTLVWLASEKVEGALLRLTVQQCVEVRATASSRQPFTHCLWWWGGCRGLAKQWTSCMSSPI